jgi:hypothetical protein
MTETTKTTPKKRGRKPGTKMTPKIRLKHNPKTAREDYYKKYGSLGLCVIYGIDEFTESLIDFLWEHPEMEFLVTDPNESKLSNINRKYSQRSFSMYRWDIRGHVDFIAKPMSSVIVVAKDLYDEVKKLPNPENVKLIVLEEI